MELPLGASAADRTETRPAFWVLTAALLFNFWAATVGWNNLNLPGVEFRQAQTAISAHFIQQENNFSLAYPTPVLGKPWSIPMEFPLYQWTVVVVSNATGVPLTQSGRLVGLLCFYLTLPAVFLLLGHWEPSAERRHLILGLILCSPVYIFYSRAFLIETMALMLSVWFLLCYVRWVLKGKWGWLVAANLLGVGAALVKITTFGLYLAPAAGWTLLLGWRTRPTAANSSWVQLGRIFVLGAAATVLPLVAALWWIHYADGIKQLNPLSQFLVSANMTEWHFGTNQTRFAARVWQGHWTIISQGVIWLPLLIAGGVLVLLAVRQRWGVIALCLGCFMGIQVLFPELYAWHEYYYVANALFLLVALGIGMVALLDSRLPHWAGWVVVAGIYAGQIYHFASHYYPEQSRIFQGGSGMTQALNELTERDDVLLIAGEDWNAMIPYYAKRRALMIRDDVGQNEAHLRAGFAALKGEMVGALITRQALSADALLLRLAVEYFGLDPQPVLTWHEHFIYFPDQRLDRVYEFLQTAEFNDVQWAPGGGPSGNRLAGAWYETKALRRYQLFPFRQMQPQPVRFYSSFGLGLDQSEGQIRFGAHPLTQLCFAVPAGARHLQTEIGISPGAYENVSADDATDGVDLKISLVQPDAAEKLLYSRNLNPRDNPADRAILPVSLDFIMPAGAELKISVEAGPSGNNRRDWAFLGKLTIK